jgi:chromosome segregation ATPase
LTCTVQDLEVQLQEQEADANEAISSWEKKAEELETEVEMFSHLVAELKERLEVEEDSMIIFAFEDVIRAREEAMQERDSTTLLLQSSGEKAESVHAKISQLEGSLDQQKTIIEELENDRTQSRQQLSALKKHSTEAKDRCEELSNANEDLMKSNEEANASRDAHERSEELLKNQLFGLEKELDRVQEDRKRLKEMLISKSREKLEEERDRLTVVIAELEEELREANDMVQAYVTDASSKKATEMAAQALRDEIEHLRCQIDEYRVAAENEKTAREASDLEIERLRDDITALVALGDEGLGSDDIQVLTAKASEKLKSKERQEIEQIRKSLYRAIDELEVARAAEKEANEKLSKARLQNSVCEQEIVAAKSEIIFLTQALEDMRLAEEGKRASLEYHINSIEDENDVLRKYNTDELQSVRNELAQVSMEKDRIVSQLKESEKTNKALVVSGSKGEYGESDARHEAEDLEAEVSKLRVENAYLLTISANDKSRAERRLREMLGAQAAATEADTILEHELRIAAEATIQTLKIEIEQLKVQPKDEGDGNIGSSRTKNLGSVDGLANEIDSLKKEIQKLKKENSVLKSKLEQEASKAREKIELLTEDCRRAQSKSHKLERQGRFDAAVKSEIARARMSPGISTPERKSTSQDDWMLVNNDPAMDRPDGIMTSSEGFDLIRKQKDEIQEERQMYLEFLSEHEDLLALLAQHDIERACLKSFMVERLGEDAVDQAILEAEETSRSKFGQTIRTS